MRYKPTGKPRGRPRNDSPDFKPTPTLEERQAEMRASMQRQEIKIPARLADEEVRRERFLFIRKHIGATVREYADMLGITPDIYWNISTGKTKPQMVYVKFAERLMKLHYISQYRKKQRAKKAALPVAGVQVPEDPKL